MNRDAKKSRFVKMSWFTAKANWMIWSAKFVGRATNGQVGGFAIGFGHWLPQGVKIWKNVECGRRQRR
jgi:hypothetical protein